MTKRILVTGAVALVLTTALMVILWILGVGEDTFLREALFKAASLIAVLILAALAIGGLMAKPRSRGSSRADRH